MESVPHSSLGLAVVRDWAGRDLSLCVNLATGEELTIGGLPELTYTEEGYGMLLRPGKPAVL
eukprot:2512317-Lingulodinium_polyedra.AAC.1